ncbi:hypothetical protein ACWEPM_17650 [Streptomyces sp. NPDC004244]
MPARTAVRRSAAATAVVAAVAGTALMPLSAFAAPTGDSGVMKITMSAPAPSGTLKPGGTPGTFELKVTNPSDKVRAFHPWIIGTPAGPSPLQQNDVTFQVEPVGNTPATESSVLKQDVHWQRQLQPTGKTGGFEVPAGGELTWKVTVGLGASYPTNLGDLTLNVKTPSAELANEGEASLTLKKDPAVEVGELRTWIDGIGACEGSTAPDCRELNVKYNAVGGGKFNTALGTKLELGSPDFEAADLQVKAQSDGKWQDIKGDSRKFTLPVIKEGFGSASGLHSTRVQIKLGPKSKLTKTTQFTMGTEVFLNEGNTYPFTWIKGGSIDLAPAQGTSSPSPSPSTSASPSPSASASASPSASASTTTAAGGTTTGSTGSSGSLASTGANSNTGLYSALAAALVATGGAAVWLGARRRKAASRA